MDTSYQTLLNSLTDIKLVIVGKDPFPTDAIGIPFCKPNWAEQLKSNSSGFHVLNSLGVISEDIEKIHPHPIDCFYHLANNGIVFLNLSYEFIGGKLKKVEHIVQRQQAFEINRPIMEIAERIILCGEANKNRWNNFEHPNIVEVVHPDNRNRTSRFEDVRNKRDMNWSRDAIKRTI